MLVLDDYLDRAAFLAIREAVLAPGFPWEHSAILSPSAAAHLDPADNRQQVHGFFLRKPGIRHQSAHFGIVRPLLARLDPAELIKVKVNLTPRSDRHVEYGLHVDTRRPGATTAIFYLNSNNGYTVFADGLRVSSVANRLVLFDAARAHTGASCTDAEYRLVLNLNMVMPPAAPPP